MRVLIAGGGTGGHVIPALAIARELRDSFGASVRFVGTERGIETRLVPEAEFPLSLIRVGQLKGVSAMARVKTLADLPLGVARCVELIRRFRPDVVVGVGGYASGPAMMAALLLRIPAIAFEPNAVPGLANRLVGRWVQGAAVNFPETLRYFPKAGNRARVTGIPVRREFFSVEPKQTGPDRLLIFGGSQGAMALNRAVPKIAKRLLERFESLEIVHQAGQRNRESTRESYERAGLGAALEAGRVKVERYLDGMVAEFAAADVILCRSGASTMAELAAAGKAAVLVPFPRAADDHQRKNAEVFVAAGAAEMVVEEDRYEEMLLEKISGLFADPERRARMGELARGLSHAGAVEGITKLILEVQSGGAQRAGVARQPAGGAKS